MMALNSSLAAVSVFSNVFKPISAFSNPVPTSYTLFANKPIETPANILPIVPPSEFALPCTFFTLSSNWSVSPFAFFIAEVNKSFNEMVYLTSLFTLAILVEFISFLLHDVFTLCPHSADFFRFYVVKTFMQDIHAPCFHSHDFSCI